MSDASLPPAYVGASSAARLLSVSKSAFYSYVKRGVLPNPTHLGGRTLWEVSELLTAMKRMKPSSDSPNAARPK
jgi:predicted DNA-binding transcriptional regulator AlpA